MVFPVHRRLPRCLRPLGEQYDRLEPGVHDALIVVHPDFSPSDVTPDYLGELDRALETASRTAIPVYYVVDRDWEGSNPGPMLESLLRHGGQPAPLASCPGNRIALRWWRRRLQGEVDRMSRRIGKPPSLTRVAFGGIYRDACVLAQALLWCGDLRMRPLDAPLWQPRSRPRHPFRTGDFLTRLCVF